MLTAHVIYASRTGNNEEVADIVHDCLIRSGVRVTEENVSQVKFNKFPQADILIVCTYTYGEGQLAKEATAFYSALQKVHLYNKVFGVAGSGDKSFGKNFDKAVDRFALSFKKAGAVEGASAVKIDLEPSELDIERLNQFVKKLVQVAEQLSK